MILCNKCKKISNIKINNLPFCNPCFIQSFQSKILRNIKQIKPTTKILFQIENQNRKFCEEIIKMIYEKKGIKCEYDFIEEDCELYKRDIDQSRMKNEDFESTITKNTNFFIFYLKTLNSIAVDSLKSICDGNSFDALKTINSDTSNLTNKINILSEIKDKELIYYFYLKWGKVPNKLCLDTTKYILRDFIAELDDKNGLVLYNITNTLKKI